MASKDMGKFLVYGAALFQAYHMGRAFHVYDPHGWHFFNVNFGGLILGAVMNVIVAQASLRLPSIAATFDSMKALMPKLGSKADDKQKRKYAKDLKKMNEAKTQNIYSQRGFVVLLALSVVMVAPALFILWSETLTTFHWSIIVVMAFVGAISPDVAIAVGGFISGEEKPSAVSTQKKSDKPSKQALQVTSKPAKLQGASDKQGVQVAGASTDKLQVQVTSKPDKQPVQDEALLAYWRVNPQASDGDVAKHFGKSRQAIQQRREKLIKNGVIGMNADGVAFMGVDVSSELKQAVKK